MSHEIDSEYEDGFEHGEAMARQGRPFDTVGVADNSGDSFFRGYREGYRVAR